MTEGLVKVKLGDLQNVGTIASLCRLWEFAKEFLSKYYDNIEDYYVHVGISRGFVTSMRLYQDRDLIAPVRIDLTKPAWVEAINSYMMRRRDDMKIYDADPDLNGLNRPVIPYDQYAIDTLVFRKELSDYGFTVPGLVANTVLELKKNPYDWVNHFYIPKNIVNENRNSLLGTLYEMNRTQERAEVEAAQVVRNVTVAEELPTADATRTRAIRIGWT